MTKRELDNAGIVFVDPGARDRSAGAERERRHRGHPRGAHRLRRAPSAGVQGPVTTASEWSLTRVFDVVGATIPDRDMIVWGDVRRTFGDALIRADALAAHLRSAGTGPAPRAAELENWECGQDRVAVLMHNRPEHVESILGCWRARAVPCNVNYQYTARPRSPSCSACSGTRGVIYERGLAPLLREALAQLDAELEVLSSSTTAAMRASLQGAIDFETVVAARGHVRDETSPDDIYIACTGGTTGRPKAVLWRQGDLFVAAIGGSDDADDRYGPGPGRSRRRRVVPHVAAHARRRAVDGVPRREHGRDRRAPRRRPALRRAHHPRHRGTRARQHDDDHRRRVRATAARGAAHERVRPLGARGARHRRHAHQRGSQGRPRRDASRRHHP